MVLLAASAAALGIDPSRVWRCSDPVELVVWQGVLTRALEEAERRDRNLASYVVSTLAQALR